MLQLRVEQDRHGRAEIQKGVHILARLKEEHLPPPQPECPADGGVVRTDQHRRVGGCVQKHLRTHGSTGAFAVHPRHAHAPAVAGHQPTDVVRAGKARDAAFRRRPVLRVVLRDGDGVDHRTAVGRQMGGGVVAEQPDACCRQALCRRTVASARKSAIRTADREACPRGQDRQRRHHNAADADAVYRPAARADAVHYGTDAGRTFVCIGDCHRITALSCAANLKTD